MDRRLWNMSVGEHFIPPWKCPVCKKGHTILKPDSFHYEETVLSRAEHDTEGWDPDWIVYAFTAWGVCSNQNCRQEFALSGKGGVDTFYDEEGPEWGDYFVPLNCFPALEIFDIPAKCPRPIRKELLAAFSLFWGYREACAGRLRVVLELLMDHIGVPKNQESPKGKLVQLNLHKRIETFADKDAILGGHLMALKWLGNAGSHDGTLKKDDLLDAFEVLDHVMAEIIDERSERVAALAEALAKKHAK